VITFSGCYHGHADPFLASAGSGLATLGIPSSPGVPSGVVADTIMCEYNDVDGVASAVERYGEGLAAIFVEPVAGNMGCVPPAPGFLEALRLLCDASGALLVFDEVITGFRIARGGAQQRFGVLPDLTVLGKIVGGGLPLAAFGGRADVMEQLAPSGSVYQAGTLSGNPLATAAGLAALSLLTDDVFVDLEARVARFAEQLEKVLRDAGLEVRVPTVGTLAGLYFGDRLPTDFAGALRTDQQAYARLFHALLDAGVAIAPGAYEVMFPGLAHTDEVLDRIVDVAASAAASISG
jgi:glutamate-1-semialdehyde 2,1-aminomutase